MVKLYEVRYKPKDNNSRTLLNHTLYGRLQQQKKRGRMISYYNPGLLDSIKYNRIGFGHTFIEATEELTKEHLLDILTIFGSVSVVETEGNSSDYKTGRQIWFDKANEKKTILRVNNRCKRKILGMYSKSLN